MINFLQYTSWTTKIINPFKPVFVSFYNSLCKFFFLYITSFLYNSLRDQTVWMCSYYQFKPVAFWQNNITNLNSWNLCVTPHSQYWYFIWEWRFHSITAAMGFPLRDRITGGYPIIMKFTFSVRVDFTFLLRMTFTF